MSVAGITTVLTLSTISLDSRTSLPKVHYATGLDWFLVCSFAYCIATLLEFAAVHYFTKVQGVLAAWEIKNLHFGRGGEFRRVYRTLALLLNYPPSDLCCNRRDHLMQKHRQQRR